ncbi:CRISPR-associated RAMP protein, Cmr1 family [Sulfolobus islandicus Y.G.57.14]|uniref:CRISPR-associated RAMP protein, Cmr1 family n=1 Tax=Saccharolobus islandicus (strain Y.G.57.14 / Yellowstone \|nr:type III-B CRISPR module RAMP protein Cmr1 [Sulfolobus islandicus]ACP45033.1 CRISPR-associated RAMP protein, Cmr1 family [Sulfolobus islandicus Y.G.57.14]
MEELLMSFRLKAIYPLTGGYNRHSINEFYEENVRPTEIKGLWRWWNRVLFNTVAYSTERKLYTYESIDRLFEDVFGSENKKSAVRLEVITDEGSDNHFELSNFELDNVIDYLRKYKEVKVNLDFRDNTLIVEIEGSTKIPISFKSNLDVDKIKDLVYKNKLLSFELLGFKSIKIGHTKISDKEVIKEILLDLITNYLEYFNIKQEVTFTLNIYLDKSREHKQNFEDKLKFALYSLLVFILLGGIGRKTSRGFGSLSIVDVKCYDDSICKKIEDLAKNFLTISSGNELKSKIESILDCIKNSCTDILYVGNILSEIDPKKNVVYFINSDLFEVREINDKEKVLANIYKAVSSEGCCIESIITDKDVRKSFLIAFGGYRKVEKDIRVIKNYLCETYETVPSFNIVDFPLSEDSFMSDYILRHKHRNSLLRFKLISDNSNNSYLISYILYSSYFKKIDINCVRCILEKLTYCVI